MACRLSTPERWEPASGTPITGRVVIDATTQPGFVDKPIIELDGTNAGGSASGFRILAGQTTIRGFVINSFTDNGIEIVTGDSNTIAGNYIGTDTSGTVDKGVTGDGIDVVRADTSPDELLEKVIVLVSASGRGNRAY